MAKVWGTRAAWTILAGVAAALVVAAPAPAGRGDYRLLNHLFTVAPGSPVGAGGDGSVVLFSSFASFIPPETLPEPAEIIAQPALGSTNVDLFTWTPGADASGDQVEQFTATADIADDGLLAVVVATFNDFPSVDSRTADLFVEGQADPVKTRAMAVAFTSNADQTLPGPAAKVGEVEPRIAALGPGGATVYVWDSERKTFDFVVGNLARTSYTLSSPSVAMKSRIKVDRVPGQLEKVPAALEVKDVYVAFAGDADLAGDNADGNDEVFLWTRSVSLKGAEGGAGNVGNGGIEQVTHTVDEDAADGISIGCRTPAVSRSGEVAFVSNADITGGNPDKSDEVFVWRNGRTRQITDHLTGAIGAPRWSLDGRILVFDAVADLVRSNPDESSEIFVWDGRRVRQITEGTAGASTSPTADGSGTRIAFLTNADLAGMDYPAGASGVPEVVVTSRTGRRLNQVTRTVDGNLDGDAGPIVTNEGPILTSSRGQSTVTFVSSSNVDGRNSTKIRRIWRTQVSGGVSR